MKILFWGKNLTLVLRLLGKLMDKMLKKVYYSIKNVKKNLRSTWRLQNIEIRPKVQRLSNK